jgi:hypothetical protein
MTAQHERIVVTDISPEQTSTTIDGPGDSQVAVTIRDSEPKSEPAPKPFADQGTTPVVHPGAREDNEESEVTQRDVAPWWEWWRRTGVAVWRWCLHTGKAVYLYFNPPAGDRYSGPEIWSEQRPSLRNLWMYARYGEYTAADGLVRKAGLVWVITVAWPITARAYLKAWIIERPGRAIFWWVLLWLFRLTPPGQLFFGLYADALRLLADLLDTN